MNQKGENESEGHLEEEDDTRIQSLIDKMKLVKILECPICTEIPFPPIHSCENGHIVCKTCLPKLTQCGLCRGSFNEGRNFPLEGIILASSFTCKFKDRGCDEVIPGNSFEEHIRFCKFNPFFVLCNETKERPCHNVMIGSNHYLEHLRTQHLCETGRQRNQDIYRFVQVDDEATLGHTINTDYFEQDGEAFLQKWQFQDNMYYTWICGLNMGRSKLENWIALITVHYQDHGSKTHFSAALPIQDACMKLEDVKATGAFLPLLPSQLKAFGGSGERILIGKTWEYCWNSDCTIRRTTAT